jgi:2-polyprenyl-6-methoxyphenol hydroxylase-like FAD-dependent oxidoreductase
VGIERVGNKVKVTFADGTSATGDLVVGCDGANSVVREHLVGKEAAKASHWDISLLNFTCQFDADTARLMRAKHPILFNSFHPKNRMFMVSIQDVPDPARPETWQFQMLISWRGGPSPADFADQAARTAFVKSWAPDYTEPWRTILGAIPDDAQFGIDSITHWKPFDWSSSPLAGRVTLAGDAAHPLPPYRGQGLNVGLEDAAQLTDGLPLVGDPAVDLPGVVERYEEEMIARALRELPISPFAAEIAHDFERVVSPQMLFVTLDVGSLGTNIRTEGSPFLSTGVEEIGGRE